MNQSTKDEIKDFLGIACFVLAGEVIGYGVGIASVNNTEIPAEINAEKFQVHKHDIGDGKYCAVLHDGNTVVAFTCEKE